jgi:hypothetical protein
MAGGARPGAGRPKGSTPVNIEREEAINASGLTPLEYMLRTLRDSKNPATVRMEAAKAAAPYVHPKLAQVQHKGFIGNYDLTKLSDADLLRLETILRDAAATNTAALSAPIIDGVLDDDGED